LGVRTAAALVTRDFDAVDREIVAMVDQWAAQYPGARIEPLSLERQKVMDVLNEADRQAMQVVTGSGSLQSRPSSTHPAKHIVGSSNPNDPDLLAATHADLYQQELVRLKAQEDYQQSRAAKLKAREIEFVEDYLIGSTRYPSGSRATFGPDEAADYIWRGVARDPRTGEQGERFTGTTVLRVDDISQDQGIGTAKLCSPGASASQQPERAAEEKPKRGRPSRGDALNDRLPELRRAAVELANGLQNNRTVARVAAKLSKTETWSRYELTTLQKKLRAEWWQV